MTTPGGVLGFPAARGGDAVWLSWMPAAVDATGRGNIGGVQRAAAAEVCVGEVNDAGDVKELFAVAVAAHHMTAGRTDVEFEFWWRCGGGAAEETKG